MGEGTVIDVNYIHVITLKINIASLAIVQRCIAVSYTHLDVYKRQLKRTE